MEPGDDANDRADALLSSIDLRIHPLRFSAELKEITARALQAYGDERARNTNEARKKAEGWCDVHQIYHRNFKCEHGAGIPLLEVRAAAIEQAARAIELYDKPLYARPALVALIRALAAKPGS
jgi:hypothetical protein